MCRVLWLSCFVLQGLRKDGDSPLARYILCTHTHTLHQSRRDLHCV